MSVDADANRGVTCATCGAANSPTDRFCEGCGSQLTARPPTPPPPPWLEDETVDSTTRYLCAAAHLDSDFARDSIGEYLVEPLRAVPPSPGIDAGAVLGDAVAARRRSKIRDGALVALFVLSLFIVTGLTVFWTVVAIAVTMAIPSQRSPRRARAAVGGVAALVLVLALAFLFFTGYGRLLVDTVPSGSAATMWTAILLAVAAYAVLTTDEVIVEHLVRDRFRLTVFRPNAMATNGWERTIRTLGHASFDAALRRVAAGSRPRDSDGSAAVVVHRGWVPFIGSGLLVADQTISLPLQRADDAVEPRPFTADDLNTSLREAMRAFRGAASLSPGRRLARLQVTEQVFVPADQLTRLAPTPLAEVLVDAHHPPADQIPLVRARMLANHPAEPGRYYLCFRVEAWDRDLVTSCFLTAATDQRTLYLEWSHSVLPPLKDKYRSIDRPAEMVPGLVALLAAIVLPATLPVRVANLFHRFRRLPESRGGVDAERFGAGRSLRELAAAGDTHNFFQDADIARYIKLVEQAVFRAVGEFLEVRGYSINDVLTVARTRIAGNITINGGTFTNSAIGIGRAEQNSGRPAGPSPTSPTTRT